MNSRLLLAGCIAVSSLCSAQTVYTRFSDNFAYVAGGRSEWLDLDNDNDLDLLYCGYQNFEPATVLYENVAGVLTARSTNLPPLAGFAAADFDKDGDIDLLGYSPLPDPFTRIFINTGAFSFSQGPTIGQFDPSGVAWFDLDNDSDLDIVTAGGTSGIKIFENTGSAFSSIPVPAFSSCTNCSPKVADANGDGKTDILISGTGIALYFNIGNKTFIPYNRTEFRQVNSNDAAFGDFDDDGDLDLVVSGSINADELTFFYENRAGKFTEKAGTNLTGRVPQSRHGVISMNLNNDEKLDVLITGFTDVSNSFSGRVSAFRNNGSGTFTDIQDAYLNSPGTSFASFDPGDYDNDGDTDLAFQGQYTILDGFPVAGPRIRIISGYFRQGNPSTAVSNTNPSPPDPATFKASAFRKEIRLIWGSGSDTQTPDGGLFYNFYLRDATKKLIAPIVDFTNGKRFTFDNPNATAQIGYAYDMPEGDLYYAVQSVDGGKASSVFSAEKMFYHFNGPEGVKVEFSDQSHVTLEWLDHSAIETNYEVSRSTAPLTSFGVLATLAANTKNYSDNFSFETETKYYYRIRGYNTQASVYDSLMLVIPARPTGITAHAVNASVVNLTWKDESLYETGFVVERKYGAGNFEVIANLPSDTEQYQDIGLAAGSTFEYRVRSKNEHGSLSPIGVTSTTTNFKPTGTNFTISTDEDKAVTFSLTDFTNNFSDVNPGDQLVKLKIISLPSNGVLNVYTSKAVVGQEVTSDLFNFLEFKPEANFAGTVSFNVRPFDGKDYSDTDWKITITLAQVNDPPIFSFESGRSLNEDFTGSSSVQASGSYFMGEELQTITYSLSPETSDIVNVIFDKNLGRIIFTSLKDKFGEKEFTITANDGQPNDGTYVKTFKLTITPVDDPMVLEAITDMTVDPIAPVTIVLDATDVDNELTPSMFRASSTNSTVLRSDKITFGLTDDMKIKMTMIPENKLGLTFITVSDNYFLMQRSFKLTTAVITAVKEDGPETTFFPNPATSTLSILLKGDDDKATVFIKDTLGRTLISKNVDRSELTIDIDHLSRGIYFVEIDSNDGSHILKRFVKL
ncbi:MAG TPA: FG-GAP-like repeat-containing protein [Cyclobacteriaceae bacterium]|nr:FG-GAP-like repeat-containing protein [Cyclobacteriaceae bacterium]